MPLITLFVISLLTRFVFLFFGFPSLTHDEADYFLNSYLLTKTGSDIFSNKFFLTSGILNATSAIPVYLGSISYYFLEKSVISGRLPYAIFNSLIPVLFYFILFKLTKNKTFSLIGFTVLNFSPWFSYLSAMSSIDAPTALVFYLLAVIVLLAEFRPIAKYSLFTLSMFFSFNSYMGFKTIAFFLIFIALLLKDIFYREKITAKKVVRNVTISLVMFLFFFTLSWISPAGSYFKNRLKAKILPLNTVEISKSVNSLREMSKGPTILRYFIHNKLTYLGGQFIDKYIQAYNPTTIFVKGDTHPLYGTGFIGLFYFFDLVFILVGFYFASHVFKDNYKIVIPFFLIILVTPIALGAMADSSTLSLRGLPLILGYSFFISTGVYFLANYLSKNKKIIILIVFLIYLSSFIYFLALYKTTIRYMSGEQWHMNEKRLLDKVLSEKKFKNRQIYIYVNDPKETMLLYLFYKEKSASKIKSVIGSGKFEVGNITFSDLCPDEKILGSVQIMNSERCPINLKVFTYSDFITPEISKGSKYLLLQ